MIQSIQIQTIDYCNRSCKWCPQKDEIRKTNGLMNEEMFYDILDQAKNIPTLKTFKPFAMNEPFCDERMFRFLQDSLDGLSGVRIAIDSNGDFLRKPENVDKLNELLKDRDFKILINMYDESSMRELRKIKLIDGNYHFSKKAFHGKLFWNRAGNLGGYKTRPQNRTNCFIQNTATINYLGQIVHCCCDYKFESILGHVDDGILGVYNSEPWVTYRRLFDEKNQEEIPLCKRCNRCD